MVLTVLSIIIAVLLAAAALCVAFLFDRKSKSRLYKIAVGINLAIIGIITGGFILRANLPTSLINLLGNFTTVFLTSQLICGFFIIVALIIRAIYRKFNKPQMFSPARRRALAYGMFYPIFSLAVSLYSNQCERNETVDNFFDVPIKNLPPDLENFRIAQISDIHLGAYFSLERLTELLQRIADAKPDLLAITGDIFDDVEMNPSAIKIVDSFTDKFKYGIYYCHGNHEHHRGIAAIEKKLTETNIHWLVNRSENVFSKLYIVGVDYPSSSPMMKSGNREDLDRKFDIQKREYLAAAMSGIPEDSVCILLAHHPEFIDDAAEKNIPLTLTGHTHGSQIGIFGMPLFPVFKYTRGVVKIGESFGYVHVGNGSWFPFRLGCPPEIAYFTLVKF